MRNLAYGPHNQHLTGRARAEYEADGCRGEMGAVCICALGAERAVGANCETMIIWPSQRTQHLARNPRDSGNEIYTHRRII